MCGWERDRDREGERDDKWVLGEENESNIEREEESGKVSVLYLPLKSNLTLLVLRYYK